jgi:outer membrane receptor for Fe3+-dicitrate
LKKLSKPKLSFALHQQNHATDRQNSPGKGFEHRAEAERFLEAFRERLSKFGLELNSEKTRLIEFGRFAAPNRERRGEGRAFQTPAAIYVITGDDIERSGATSIPEALRLAPGVEVTRIDSNKWAIGIRGFGSRLSRSSVAAKISKPSRSSMVVTESLSCFPTKGRITRIRWQIISNDLSSFYQFTLPAVRVSA